MNSKRPIRSTRFCQALAAALSMAVVIGGCAKFNPRGDGFADSFQESAGYRRPVEKSAIPFGVSTKAREIERDFGIQ